MQEGQEASFRPTNRYPSLSLITYTSGKAMPTIRRATADDLETVIELRMAFLREAKPDVTEWEPILEATRRYVSDKLPAGEFLVWFAEEEGQVVGTAGLVFFHRPPTSPSSGLHAYVMNMYTLPAYRGRGIATELLQHVIDYARSHSAGRICLHALDTGRALYQRLGFEPCANEMSLLL